MKKGFTLMELIVVVIIVGILAMVGLPQFFQVAERGRAAEANGVLGSIRSAQIRYFAENQVYVANCAALDVNFTTLKYFANPVCGLASATMAKSTGANYTVTMTYANGTLSCSPTANCPKGY
ncbi:MAG: prepilin-type N-terminal cleavage/methylation domain-containing protein [Candidatus Omnitrophota bacterium]